MGSVNEAFQSAASRFGRNIALRSHDGTDWREMSYAELDRLVEEFAAGLQCYEMKRGSKIAILSENRAEWIVSFLAAQRLGAVAVPVDAQLGEDESANILNHSEAELLVLSHACEKRLPNLTDRLTTVRAVIHLGSDMGKVYQRTSDASAARSQGEGEDEWLRGRGVFETSGESDVAILAYTSGTSGAPKGVMLTHGNLLADLKGLQSVIELGPKDNSLALLPLHGMFGLMGCLLWPLSHGSAVSFVDIMSPDRARLIEECKPTLMTGPPILYARMQEGIMRKIEASPVGRPGMMIEEGSPIAKMVRQKLGGRISWMICGAAPADLDMVAWYQRLGIEFLEAYGITEGTCAVTMNPVGAIKPGSVGRALEGVELRIDGPDEEGDGEILIKGLTVMNGYFKDDQETERSIRDGWLLTGDLGRIDSEGYLFITGRKKNVIVTASGKNVYPEWVERILNQSPLIADSLVFGYRGKGEVGEEVGALILPDFQALAEEARSQGIPLPETIERLADDPDARVKLIELTRSILGSEIEAARAKLSPKQRVTRYRVEHRDFERTSTRKIKRFLYRRSDLLGTSRTTL